MAAYVDAPRDPLTRQPAWQIAYNQVWAQEQDRHVLERMQAIDAAANVMEAPRSPYVPLTEVSAWAGSSQSDEALIVDRELALSSPCTRLEIGDQMYLYYSRGASGALSDEQVKEFCVGGFEDQVATTEQRERLYALVEAAPFCRTETMASAPDNRLGAYYSCLGKELRKKGVEP